MSAESAVAGKTHRDRIIAASGHAAIMLPLLGIVVPLVIWTIRGRESPIVAFQARQAAIYQFISVLGGSVILAPLMCVFCFMLMCNGGCPPKTSTRDGTPIRAITRIEGK